MREQQRIMLKIGEFAQIGQVSIATLRHYDQYGLLKPSALDPHTGYRYYVLDQLPRLHRIVVFKDLGFPLEQIARLLEENLSLEQLQGMFRLKQAQIAQVIDTEQARLTHIAARLRHIEQEGSMPAYDVRLKQAEPLLVATVRETVPIDGLGRLYGRIAAYLDQQGVQPTKPDLLLRHSRYEMRTDGMYADVELAFPLPTSLPDSELVSVRMLPASLMACIVHTGNSLLLGQAYLSLHHWLEDNGYRLIAAPREVYLKRAEHMTPSQYVTEVQFPVEKQ